MCTSAKLHVPLFNIRFVDSSVQFRGLSRAFRTNLLVIFVYFERSVTDSWGIDLHTAVIRIFPIRRPVNSKFIGKNFRFSKKKTFHNN